MIEMALSDKDIREYIKSGKLSIDPLEDYLIRENGVDLRLGGSIARYRESGSTFDPQKDSVEDILVYEDAESFIINPYERVLIHTIEYIKLPNNLIGLINLRSSYARLGLSIPPTVIDANFEGQLTIGLVGGSFPVKLYKGERFIHIVFLELKSPSSKPYTGRYQGQKGIQPPIFRK